MSEFSYEEYWEKLASSSEYHPANRLRYSLISDAVITAIPTFVERQISLVDVGCGDGSLLRSLSKLTTWDKVHGIDVSSLVVSLNRTKIPDIAFTTADMGRDLEYAPELLRLEHSFDLVVSSEVIEHVEDDSTFVFNLTRLCKPSGRVIVTTQAGPRYRMDLQVLGHLRHYTEESLRNLLIENGLVDVTVERRGFPWLNLQKKLVDLFFDRVQNTLLAKPKLSRSKRTMLGLLSKLYHCDLKGKGPQLIAYGRFPSVQTSTNL